MHLTRRSLLGTSAAFAALPALAQGAAPYGLKSGKPYSGAKLNILAVVTPQFQALEKRQAEFTALTGINATWDFVPFPALQDKVTSIGVGSDDTYDVVNYLDGWGPPNAHWFVKLEPLLKRDGLSMDRYLPAFVEQDSRVSFQQGKSAMIPIWEWAYSPMVTPGQSVLTAAQVGFTKWPTYEGRAITCASTLPFSLNSFSRKQDAAWEFMKWLSNSDLDKRNAIERDVGGFKIINNVVNESANFLDAEVNAANAGVPRACYESLKQADTLPMIPEWPQVGDLLANAIEQAAGGGNVRALMTKAASDATTVLKQAGYN